MAIARQAPKCPHCGEVIAKAIYRDQSNVPMMMRLIGDTFIGWKYFEHSCPGKEVFDKKMKEEFDKSIQEMKDSGNSIPPFFKQ